MAALPLSKVVDAQDFSAPALLPYLREIAESAARRPGRADEAGSDASIWKEAMALRALDTAGVAAAGRTIAIVDAGTSPLVFALARRGVRVYAADRYLDTTASNHAAPRMLSDPERFATSPIPRGHVLGVHSTPGCLNLASDSFDGVVSLGLERSGSLERVAASAREIGRVLRPGGLAAIATEFRLEGPNDRLSFDERFVLFTEKTIIDHVAGPAGLKLRAPIITRQSDATFESRHLHADFERRDGLVEVLEQKRAATSDLVLYHEGFLFCPVVVVLDKQGPVKDARASRARRPMPSSR